MCTNPDERLLFVKRGWWQRVHDNAVECYFTNTGKLIFIFYPPFWEKFGKFVGMNDYVRLYADKDMTYVRMQAQPLNGQGCYKMSKRPNSPTLRQIVLSPTLASQFPKHEGRKVLDVKQENRSIILSF